MFENDDCPEWDKNKTTDKNKDFAVDCFKEIIQSFVYVGIFILAYIIIPNFFPTTKANLSPNYYTQTIMQSEYEQTIVPIIVKIN